MGQGKSGGEMNKEDKKMLGRLRGMIDRCYNEKNVSFHRYGGRGINVCDRWLDSFGDFLKDMGYPSKGLSIDRINNDGNYEPDNCRWATRSQQARNQSLRTSFRRRTMEEISTSTYRNILFQDVLLKSIEEEQKLSGINANSIVIIAVTEYLKRKEKERLK